MKLNTNRRQILKSLLAVPFLASTGMLGNPANAGANPPSSSRLKVALNSYSFNDPLRKGTMSLDDLLEFCGGQGIDAVDLTGYYFPGYPSVPTDEYIYHIKRMAYRLGLDISGTGIRNDFTDPDENKRKADIQLVKNWIECASKMGAPVIRIFAGIQNRKGFSWDEVAKWMMKDIKECVEYGKNHGVVVAIQNHNDFIQTADQAIKIIKMIDSEWFGLVLDIGSYRVGDPFKQIADTAPFAVNWQIKENMYENGVEVKTDLGKIMGIIKSSGYTGYLPIETLGAGDPAVKVPVFLEKVRKALAES
ncbi:MAG: sugar phosphate isomerase/epimerase family protein [Chitinophagaceae bacterium]